MSIFLHRSLQFSRSASNLFQILKISPSIATALTVVITFAHTPSADAVSPGVNTEAALHRLKLSMPVDLQTVMDKNQIGLDFEDKTVQARTLTQAHDYLAFRKGELREKTWLGACQRDVVKKIENPFCDYELDRHEAVHGSHVGAAVSKTLKRSIATQLKSGNFDSLQKTSLSEMIGGVAALGSIQAVKDLAREVSSQKGCVNSAIPYALGYKLEEDFPDASTVNLSKDLYRKSVNCGSDLAAATASFRLGLIHIWQNECQDVSTLMLKTEKTPTASTYHARAKYWRYYCGDKQKNQLAMTDARASLLREHPLSFQNLAINGETSAGLGNVLQASDPQLAFRSLVRPELNGLLRASEAMMKLGNNPIATDILDRHVSSINEMEPEVRLYSAVLLNRLGSALPKFKILTNLFDESPRMISLATMKLYFPLWYFDLVKIKKNEIDPLLILSLIRQESAFNRQAFSTVGARGLMQVMPATARTVSRKGAKNLFDPKTNINIGTIYLMRKLQQFGGDVELTLAAYNAGFGRVDDWLKRYPTDNKMLFLDFIPFRETRDYVSLILRNYYWYVKLYEPTSNLEVAQVLRSAIPHEVNSPVTSTSTPVKTSSAGESASQGASAETISDLVGAGDRAEVASSAVSSPLNDSAIEPTGPFSAEDDDSHSSVVEAEDISAHFNRANFISAVEKKSIEAVVHEIKRGPASVEVSTTAKRSLGTRMIFVSKNSLKFTPKTAAIMSANAGLAAGVLGRP